MGAERALTQLYNQTRKSHPTFNLKMLWRNKAVKKALRSAGRIAPSNNE
jgi:hypothetical protein